MPSRRDNSRRLAAAQSREPSAAVRLTRKYAEMIDGVDLRAVNVGDRLHLPVRAAEVLVAEGWAEEIGPAGAEDGPRDPTRDTR